MDYGDGDHQTADQGWLWLFVVSPVASGVLGFCRPP